MKLSRRERREAAFLLLYQSMLNDDGLEEIIDNDIAEFELALDKREEAVKTVEAVIANAAKADEIIERYSKTRKIARIPKISLAVMRLALYEMDNVPEIPGKVVVNEAIELCKKYADDSDRVFVSGLLGAYYKETNNES